MDGGKIMQVGTPEDIYRHPASAFVANFIGMTNFLSGKVVDAKKVKLGTKLLPIESHSFSRGEEVKIAARPEAVKILKTKTKQSFEGKIIEMEFLGSFIRLHIETSLVHDGNLLADLLRASSVLESRAPPIQPPIHPSFQTRRKWAKPSRPILRRACAGSPRFLSMVLPVLLCLCHIVCSKGPLQVWVAVQVALPITLLAYCNE